MEPVVFNRSLRWHQLSRSCPTTGWKEHQASMITINKYNHKFQGNYLKQGVKTLLMIQAKNNLLPKIKKPIYKIINKQGGQELRNWGKGNLKSLQERKLSFSVVREGLLAWPVSIICFICIYFFNLVMCLHEPNIIITLNKINNSLILFNTQSVFTFPQLSQIAFIYSCFLHLVALVVGEHVFQSKTVFTHPQFFS